MQGSMQLVKEKASQEDVFLAELEYVASFEERCPEVFRPVFCNDAKFSFLQGGRRIGKTEQAVDWICVVALSKPNQHCLWVDTGQSQLDQYVQLKFIPKLNHYIAQNYWKDYVKYDKEQHIIYFANGSFIHMRSAERPEKMEGFDYDYGVLNEAGIILKKAGLWENTISPMTMKKGSQFKIVGTPKGFVGDYKNLCDLAQADMKLYTKGVKNPRYYWQKTTSYQSPFVPPEEVDEKKKTTAAIAFRQEYLADFVDTNEDSVIKLQNIHYYATKNPLSINDIQMLSIHADTTHTGKKSKKGQKGSDYFCIGLWAKTYGNEYYLLDYRLEQISPREQALTAISFYQEWFGESESWRGKLKKATFDAVGNDTFGHYIKDLAAQQDVTIPFEAYKFKSNKIDHLNRHVDLFLMDKVFLPAFHLRKEEAEKQLIEFPNGMFDDFVDMVSGGLDHFKQKPKRRSFKNTKIVFSV